MLYDTPFSGFPQLKQPHNRFSKKQAGFSKPACFQRIQFSLRLRSNQIRQERAQLREEGIQKYGYDHHNEERHHATNDPAHRKPGYTDRRKDIHGYRRRRGTDNQGTRCKNAIVNRINSKRLRNREHQRQQQQGVGIGVHKRSENQENHEGQNHKGCCRRKDRRNAGYHQGGQPPAVQKSS